MFFIGYNGKSTETEIFVDGCNEQVLMYMAESGKDNVLLEIQSLPAKFGIELTAFANFNPLPSVVPRVKTFKVFISSTFLDLAEKRDILIDHVIPELNQKSRRLENDAFELVPVDIRFGEMVDEADAVEAVSVCLKQLITCDLVVHIVGNRYGTIPKYLYRGTYPPRGLEFLKDLDNVSITEAEITCAKKYGIPIIHMLDETCTNERNLKMLDKKNTIQFTSTEDYTAKASMAISSQELKSVEKKTKNKPEIIGRRILLDQAASSVFHSQLTCIRGDAGMGKTLLMKWLFDLEKSKNRQVAWLQCQPDQTTDELLDSLRQ